MFVCVQNIYLYHVFSIFKIYIYLFSYECSNNSFLALFYIMHLYVSYIIGLCVSTPNSRSTKRNLLSVLPPFLLSSSGVGVGV